MAFSRLFIIDSFDLKIGPRYLPIINPNFEDALENAKNIFGMNLVTHQTGTQGQLVKKVYVTEAFDIVKEYYAAITLDRSKGMDVFMVSSEGGVEIEKVAEETPEKITKVYIDPLLGIKSFQAKKLADEINEISPDHIHTGVLTHQFC